jgi:hypothetical protein
VAGCCEYGDEPSGSGATELVMGQLYFGFWIKLFVLRRTNILSVFHVSEKTELPSHIQSHFGACAP